MKSKTLPVLALGLVLLMSACAAQNTAVTPDTPGTPDAASVTPADTPSTAATPEEDTKTLAYANYANAMSQITAAPGGEDVQIDMDMDMRMNMSMLDQNIAVNSNGNIKTIVEDGKTKFSSVINTESDYGSNTIEMLYDGEKMYYAVDGVETELDASAFEQQMGSTVNMPEFGIDAIKSFETADVPEGKKTTFVIDGTKMTGYIMEAAGEEMALLGDIGDITMEDMTIEVVTAENGDPVSVGIQMAVAVSAESIEDITMDMSMKFTINQIGSGVVIDTSKLETV
ncbi:MAG: hypothetical protein LBR76_07780 [Oscillospiraceae bacterium]|jgi:hypothetical protein|nr:hypothetical protein [Oscillospiraceae bacterium]